MTDANDYTTGDPLAEQIRLLNEGSVDERLAATQSLGRSHTQLAVAPLITHLGNGNRRVRDAVIDALVRLGQLAVVQLITALDHTDTEVRADAADALGQIGELGDVTAVEPLTRLLGNGGHAGITAARALGRLGDPRALPPLIAALSDDEASVREASIEALGQLGVSAIDPLIALTSDSGQREAAIQALVRIAEPSVHPLVGQSTAKRREAAAEALEQLARIVTHMPEGIKPLIRLLDASERRAESVIRIVLQIGERAVAPLVTLLGATEPGLHAGVVRMLKALGWVPTNTTEGATYWIIQRDWKACAQMGPVAVEPLLTVLAGDAGGDQDRAKVIRALGQLSDRRAVGPVIAALSRPDRNERAAAVEALGQLGDAAALNWLVEAISDPKVAMCNVAAKALGQIGDTRAIAPLIAVLRDGRPDTGDQDAWPGQGTVGIRLTAAHALGQLGPQAVAPLLDTLGDPRSIVRRSVAIALGQLGDSSVVETLLRLLDDSNGDVVETAAYALGQIGDRRAVEPLLKTLMRGALSEPSSAEESESSPEDYFELFMQDPLADAHEELTHHTTQSVAAWALGQIGDQFAVVPMIVELQHAPTHVRSMVARALGQLGGDQAVDALIAVLGDKDEVCRAAASALGQLGDARAVSPLIDTLKRRTGRLQLASIFAPDEAIITALGQLGNLEAVTPLLDLLESRDRHLCRVTVNALGQLRDTRTTKALIVVAHRTGDIPLQEAAIQALGGGGDPRAIEALIAIACRPGNVSLQKAAIQALGASGDRRAVEALADVLQGWDTLPPDQIVVEQALRRADIHYSYYPELQVKLQNDRRIVQLEAALALGGAFGDPRAVAPLIAAMRHQNSDVRRQAAAALGRCRDIRALEPLIVSLSDWNADVRQAAAEALGALGDPQALDSLLEVLTEQHGNARRAVVQALITLGGTLPMEQLLRLLHTADTDVRRFSAQHLGQLGDIGAADSLVGTLGDEDWQVREAAANALEVLGWRPRSDTERAAYWVARQEWDRCAQLGEVALAPLSRMLKDAWSAVSQAAARALERLGTPKAAESLIKALRVHDPMVRREAAHALASYCGPAVINALVERLQDGDQAVRAAAIRTLGQLGARMVAAQLVERLTDPEAPIRALVAEVLGQLGDTHVAKPLITALGDPALNVRLAAIRSIEQLKAPAAVLPLIEQLDDVSADIQAAAAIALGRLGDVRAVEPMVARLQMQVQKQDKQAQMRIFTGLQTLATEQTIGAFAWYLHIGKLAPEVQVLVANVLSRFAETGQFNLQKDIEAQLVQTIQFVAEHHLECGNTEAALICYADTVRYYSAKVDDLTAGETSDAAQKAARFCFALGRSAVRRFVERRDPKSAGYIAACLANLAHSLGNNVITWHELNEICEAVARAGDDSVALQMYEQVIALIESTWFMQSAEEAGLRTFFADKAELYDGLALCYLRLGAAPQAWETLEAAKTRYLGDLITRRQRPPLELYRPVVEEIWEPVRRARATAEGHDEDAPVGMRELVGMEPATEADIGLITVGQHQQALDEYLGKRRSNIRWLIETLWEVPVRIVGHPLAPAVREAFKPLRQYVDQLIRQEHDASGMAPDSVLLEALKNADERIDELERSLSQNSLELPFAALSDYLPELHRLGRSRDVPHEQTLLELEALLEVLNLISGEGKVFVTTRPRLLNDPPSTAAPVFRSRTGLSATSNRRRMQEAKQRLVDAWDQVAQTRWRYVTQLARGQTSSFVSLRSAIAHKPCRAVVAFHVTRQGTIVYLARSISTSSLCGSLLPAEPDMQASHVIVLPHLTLDALHALVDKDWLVPLHLLTESGRDQRTAEDAKAQTDQTLRHIYNDLLRRIDQQLRAWCIQQIVFIPHRSLHLLPLHACWREVGGHQRYLIDDYEITYAPSSTLLEICRERAVTRPFRKPNLLTVANPTDGLQFTAYEVEQIEDCFSGDCTKLDRNTAQLNTLTEQSLATHIHFSCHGVYDWKKPLESHLLLAGNTKFALGDLFDEVFLLSTPTLVVLSACESGRVDRSDLADEYLGIASGFLFAGAPAVVSSLWRVNDLSSALLMERFYVYHLQDGQRPAAALRAAQRWLRDVTAEELAKHFMGERDIAEDERRKTLMSTAWRRFASFAPEACPFNHPFYWAAFTLTGA